jgi:hypothetical protein
VIVGVGWAAILSLWVFRVDPLVVAVGATVWLLLGALYAKGLVGWERYFKSKK